MIAKLKTECGYHFTSKLEGMFTDMVMSKGTMEQFAEASAAARDAAGGGGGGASSLAAGASLCDGGPRGSSFGGVELEVTVLTAAHWPASMLPACPLPAEVLSAQGAFTDFYLTKHTGRKLAWQTVLGTADLKARFGRNKHELSVSTFQMCILMRFNGAGNATQSLEALEELGIPKQELRRHLVSLCTPKHRILCKESKGKSIEDNDSFTFNEEFTSKLKRVKVPLVSAKEAVSIGDTVPEAVDEDRRHLVEASIVRIMKSRRKLQHNELIAEVTRQLQSRFSPVPAFIKKRVESLIEREYLERSADDRRVYTYLA